MRSYATVSESVESANTDQLEQTERALNPLPLAETWTARLFRNGVIRAMRTIPFGTLKIVDGEGETVLGGIGEGPEATITVRNQNFWERIAMGGSIGAGEAYALGWWQADSLTDVIRVFARNRDTLNKLDSGLTNLVKPALKFFHYFNRNTENGSRKNISAHYDLGNDFFERFLDPTMTYSAGVFAPGSDDMHAASIEKLDRICRKLNLQPTDHVLEIGSGWGSFAIHAAKTYGCKVTTTTISKEQHAMATQRVAEAGLGDRVTVLLQDYRKLTGSYDKIVSIEMIEAVGHEYFGTYFKTCSKLLKPNGQMAFQAITITDQNFDYAKRNVDFIQRYIFPGGALPSITEVCNQVTKNSDMRMIHMEDFGTHYARTLKIWHDDMLRAWQQLKAEQGKTDEFLRLWQFYFCYCEGAFWERVIGVAQIVLTKPENRNGPVLMDYRPAKQQEDPK